MEYIYKETLTDSQIMAKLEANIDTENHESATSKPEELQEKFNRDMHYNFVVPVQKSVLTKIPGAMVQLCSLSVLFSLTNTGERESYERSAHAQFDIPYHIAGRVGEQALQHGCVPGDDLQILSHANHSLHCSTPHLIPNQESIHQQIQLLGRVLENSAYGKNNTEDNTCIRDVGVHLPTTIVWWIDKSTIPVLFLGKY